MGGYLIYSGSLFFCQQPSFLSNRTIYRAFTDAQTVGVCHQNEMLGKPEI